MRKNLTLFIVSLVLFGTNGAVAAQIDLPSHDIVVLRTFLGAMLLAGLLLARQLRARQLRARRLRAAAQAGEPASTLLHGAMQRRQPVASARDYLFVALSGVALGLAWMLLFRAYPLVGVGMASLLYYVGPVIVMALAPVLFAEKLTPVRVAGFAAVLAGMVLLNATGAQSAASLEGIACGLGSAVCLAAMIVLNKKASALEGLQRSCIQLAAAFATSAAITVCTQGMAIDVASVNWLAVAMLGLVNTGLGCYLYFANMSKLPVQTVAACGYIEPVSAVAMATLFLGEVLLPVQALGAALIVAGAAVGELGPSALAHLRKPMPRRA